MLAVAEPGLVDGLLLLSYPLHPPIKSEQPRIAHLPNLRTPALFVRGSRDTMGTIEEMQDAVKLIPSHRELVTVHGAGHELVSARTVSDVTTTVAEAFWKFARRHPRACESSPLSLDVTKVHCD
jgi:predicted alpha/beta-hydrolase family hydrolase